MKRQTASFSLHPPVIAGVPTGGERKGFFALKIMTYSEKLRDPRWQKKRLEILNRDGFACCFCLDEQATLHVHHRYYVQGREPWEYPQWAFQTLCANCHDDAHQMEEPREEGSSIPRVDPFEEIMAFFGAGWEVDESMIWDISVEVERLAAVLGRYDALSKVMLAITEIRKAEES